MRKLSSIVNNSLRTKIHVWIVIATIALIAEIIFVAIS